MENEPNIMKLEYVKGRNFKGLDNFTFTPSGKDAFIYGANGAGKTTIYDMVSYLFFDKDSAGNSNFEIKPRGMEKPEVEVEGRFVNSAGPVTLRKTYKEKWTRKRGSLESELTSHTTDYYINEVPVKQAEYKARVAGLATTETIFQLLTDPAYFNESMHWSKRRELLFDISGNVTNDQVLESMATLSNKDDIAIIVNIINNNDTDDYKKIVMGRRKKINEEIESIPARIDEKHRGLHELSCNNAQVIIDKLLQLRNSLDNKNEEISNTKSGGGVAGLRIKLAELEAERAVFVNQHNAVVASKGMGLRDELQKEKDVLDELNRAHKIISEFDRNENRELAYATQAKADLLTIYRQLNASVFTMEACPTCGQAMPEDKVEEAREQFNENQAKALADNMAKGLACAKEIADLTKSLATTEAEKKIVGGKIAVSEEKIKDLQEKIAAIQNTIPSLDELPELVEFLSRKNDLENQIAKIQAGASDAIARLVEERQGIEALIAEQEKIMAQLEQNQATELRIAELKAQQKKLFAEFETLAKYLFLIEAFIKAKISLLEESINNRFKIVKFELFRDQINGGVEEICQATVGGVPYHSLNKAAKVQAGLDVIEVVGKYQGFFPVIFVDGRESVTVLPEMTAQVISLVVSPADEVLRVEIQE